MKKSKKPYSKQKIANPWHFQQKLRGGRIHESKKRKEKYKKEWLKDV